MEILVGWRGLKQKCPPVGGGRGVWIFSGTTYYLAEPKPVANN